MVFTATLASFASWREFLRALAAIIVLSMYAGFVAAQVDTSELRVVQPLMENWKFVMSNGMSDEEALASTAQDWQSVSLPHTWNAQDAASLDARSYARGRGWYRLEFATPTAGARHWLEFGAASLVADVWLNGQHLGQHKGAFTAFRFDVTGLLAAGGTNVLLVKTDNTAPKNNGDLTAIAPLGGDFNVSGGLYRYVALVSTADPAHFALDDLGGTGVYAATTALGPPATVHVRARLSNDAQTDIQSAGNYIVRLSLLDAAGQTAASADQSVSFETGGAGEIVQDLSVASPHLWQGRSDPYLYKLVAELLRADGAPLDRVVQSFGIRQMQFDPDQGFFLNGQHLRLNGVAIHQDVLGKAWATTDADVDNTLAVVLEVGANAVRLGHYPFSRYTLERMSQLGLIAWAEAPLGLRTTVKGCRVDPTQTYVENAKQQLREMIRQQMNHAAIAMWAVGNETESRQAQCDEPYDNVTPVVRAMHEVARSEDPSRPTVYAEFSEDLNGSNPFPVGGTTDLLATNRYYLWYNLRFQEFGPLLDALRARYPAQPLGVSEYGAGAALTHHTDDPRGGIPEVRSAPKGEISYQPEEYQACVHEQQYGVISSKPYLWGSFVWNLFDFGSAHRNEGDVLGVNTKGLLAFDHQTRKDAFYFYKANWSTEPVTYIVGRRYTEREYPVADVKVYSNADAVTLSVNGAAVGKMTAAQCVQKACVFRNVRLSPGPNTVTAAGDHAGASVTDSVQWSMNATEINIAAGRLASGYVSADGRRFGSDAFFMGGRARWIETGDARGGPPKVAGTPDPQLYKYSRRGNFRYVITVTPGSWRVTLGFVESAPGQQIGDRRFSVVANGQTLLQSFDVLQAAGEPRRAVTRAFTVQATGNQLTIDFTSEQGEAIVSNITVSPAGE